ncbi:hypothetical protein F5Y07DRAFT_400719 [Xylaria sp. FL0933]|nr:hypothetical protein F5Y07DRAFT_400719 [Xylaria sp. FL0933]
MSRGYSSSYGASGRECNAGSLATSVISPLFPSEPAESISDACLRLPTNACVPLDLSTTSGHDAATEFQLIRTTSEESFATSGPITTRITYAADRRALSGSPGYENSSKAIPVGYVPPCTRNQATTVPMLMNQVIPQHAGAITNAQLFGTMNQQTNENVGSRAGSVGDEHEARYKTANATAGPPYTCPSYPVTRGVVGTHPNR